MPIIYRQEDKGIGSYRLEPDRRVVGVNLYLISYKEQIDEFLSKAIVSWNLVEVKYLVAYRTSYFAKAGISAAVAGFYFWLETVYWWVLWEIVHDRLRLIERKGREGVMFRWKDDFKPLREMGRLWDRGVY